jgi:FHA domain protein
MDNFIDSIGRFFKSNVYGNLSIYEVVSTIFKYLFVFLIFIFIYAIVRVIYYDVKSTMRKESISNTYLKLNNIGKGFRFRVEEYYYIGKENTIGRGANNTIKINDKFMSTNHAKITKEDGVFFLEDLNSANGTKLNGEKLKDKIELKNGDIIELGQLVFTFNDGGVE